MTDSVQEERNTDNSYGREQVVQIIHSVVSKVEQHGETVSKESIFTELRDLKKIIEDARREIGNVKAGDISGKHVPTATDELDAVVEATAEATGTIMDACEVIETQAGEVGGDAGDKISLAVTNIYEACSFQDITGQRITKTVSTIKAIEEKVNQLMSVLGADLSECSDDEEDTRSHDEALLNGPQMEDQAISQDEIDKLLAEFD